MGNSVFGMTLKVSVVIPAFDRLASLRSVLLSCRRGDKNVELVVVDDKSPHTADMEDLSREFNALYVRNEIGASEREPALCRNLGLEASSGDIIVFNDADVLVPVRTFELHSKYHRENQNAMVSAQVWSIPDGQVALDAIKEFTQDELKNHAHPFIQDGTIRWSTTERPIYSDNWWAFLSAHCSFKREDLLRIRGWDQEYRGWGVEDNDIAYRAHSHGLRILYTSDLTCFHINHPISRSEYRQKCRSALRNLRYMCQKYPEIAEEDRVRKRLQELETLAEGDLSHVIRQTTAGGGPIEG